MLLIYSILKLFTGGNYRFLPRKLSFPLIETCVSPNGNFRFS